MGHRHMNRRAVAGVIVVLLVALLPTTALAGVAGPLGTLIESTEFESVVLPDQVAQETVVEFAGATLDGVPIVELPNLGESPQDFAARVGAGACQYALVASQTERRFDERTSTDPILTNTDINPHGTLIDVVGMAPEDVQALMVDGNVLVIAGVPIVTGEEDFTVVWGTLEVTWTYTTYFTDHSTDVTTETYNAECFTGYQACLFAGAIYQVSTLESSVLHCGRGTPIVIGAGDDFYACLFAGALSQFGPTEPLNCGRGKPIGLSAGTTLYACHYKGALSQVNTATPPTKCGRGAPVDLAGATMRR